MLKLTLLGNPEVRVEGVVLSLPPKRLALLAYLALEGGLGCQPLRRAVLCSVLWSEQEPESARRNLRQELHRLKGHALGACLQLTPETVGLSAVDCDALRFEAADAAPVSAEHLRGVLALYGGPLLHELDLPQGGAFDDWLHERRGGLHERWLERRRQWAAHLEAAGDLGGAVEALEPLRESGDEDSAVRTMHLQARLGQREAALHTFARLEQELRALGLTPAPDTLALRERLRGLPLAAPPRRASLHHPPLIGRDTLLAELEQSLLEQGGLLLLEGEPGSGKTALASALAQRWGPGLRLQGREEAQATPFLPISEALRGALPQLSDLPPAWRREVARLLPELETGDAPERPEQGEGRARLLEGLSVALRHALGGGLLWLDDLHWFDPSSLEVLGLALRAENWRAIATARPLERRQNAPLEQLLSALERRQAVSFRELPPLTETDLLRLIRVLSASASGGVRFARRLHAATRGNPLFALETLKTLLDSGELREQDGVWHTEFDAATEDYHELPLPVSVKSAVLSRVGQLSEGTQQLLTGAALLGDAFELTELEGSTPLSGWAQLDALEQALEAGFLRADPASSESTPRYQFSHHLVQRALTSNLSAERRRWLHRQLAATLAGLEARPARLAVHLEGAGQREQAARMRLQAAQQAADVYAHLETLEHLDAALRLGLDTPTTFEVQLRRAGVYSMLDDKPAWEAALEAARACARQASDLLRLELNLCELEFHLGRYPTVLERVNALWEHPDLTLEQRGWAGLWAGNANSRTARLIEAVDWYRRALEGVPENELILRGRLLNAWAYALYVLGELEEGREKVQHAMECFVAANYRKGQAMAHNTAGSLSYAIEDDEIALFHFKKSLDLSLDVGDLQNQRVALTNLGGIYLTLGNLDESLFFINKGLEILESLPDPYAERLFYEDLSTIYTLRGQINKAIHSLDISLNISDQYNLVDWSIQGRINKFLLLMRSDSLESERSMLLLEIEGRLTMLPNNLKENFEQQINNLLSKKSLIASRKVTNTAK